MKKKFFEKCEKKQSEVEKLGIDKIYEEFFEVRNFDEEGRPKATGFNARKVHLLVFKLMLT